MTNCIFIDNKYTKLYFSIIEHAKSTVSGGYVEKHHIFPKCLGGTDSFNNIVQLSARQHFICHRLLVKMTIGIQKSKMSYALLIMMTGTEKHQRDFKLTSKGYQQLKEQLSVAKKEWWKNNLEARTSASIRQKERWTDIEYRNKMTEISNEIWRDSERKRSRSVKSKEYWKGLTSREYKQICDTMKESANQPEVIERKRNFGESNGMYGKTHTDDVKLKLGACAKERFKGKTYEELYGKQKSDAMKQKRSVGSKKYRAANPIDGIKNPNAKPVIIKGIEFETSSAAAVYFNRCRPTISRWIRKRDDCYFV